MKLQITPSQFRTLVAQTVATAPGVERKVDSKFWAFVTANMAECYGEVQNFVRGAWGSSFGAQRIGSFELEQEGRTIKLYQIVATDKLQAESIEVSDLAEARAKIDAVADAVATGDAHAALNCNGKPERAAMSQGKKGSGVVACWSHRQFGAVLS